MWRAFIISRLLRYFGYIFNRRFSCLVIVVVAMRIDNLSVMSIVSVMVEESETAY